MTYRPCRWYDVYPRLGFALRLIRFLPTTRQAALGDALVAYLSGVTPASLPPVSETCNRWYDACPSLRAGLSSLRHQGPPQIRLAETFLWHEILRNTVIRSIRAPARRLKR